MTPTEEVGAKPCAFPGGRAVVIDTVQSIVVPTTAQRTPKAGILTVVISVEGAATFRYSYSTTAPTAAVGLLGPAPTATQPVTIPIRGEALIAAFRIIGTAAGDTISYDFYFGDIA
jgi:hypothetical protein